MQKEESISPQTGGQEQEDMNASSNPPAAAKTTKTVGAAARTPALTRGSTWQAGRTTQNQSAGGLPKKKEDTKSTEECRAAAARSRSSSGPARAPVTGSTSVAAPRRSQSHASLTSTERARGSEGEAGGTSAVPGGLHDGAPRMRCDAQC
eukprot:3012166-Rhodomonas_salina.3